MVNHVKDFFSEKDNIDTYHKLLNWEKISFFSNELYKYVDDFVKMLDSEKSYVRVRGFRLICKQAKWDNMNKINAIIDKLLLQFDDDKPTVVRQYLNSIRDIIIYKSELKSLIKDRLNSINAFKYKDSMSPLILKDINELLDIL